MTYILRSFRAIVSGTPCPPLRRGARFVRCLSNLRNRARESREVRVGGSGSVKLDILFPLSAQQSGPSSVLIHLPRGPPLTISDEQDVEHESSLNHISAGFPQSTVLSINYRLSSPFTGSKVPSTENYFRYPQPIHDVSEVFTYITEELVPSMVGEQEWPRVQLYGSRFGGALAAMLALTMPNAVDTVAVEDPLVDWVMLDELLQDHDVDAPTRRKISTSSDAVDAASREKAARHLIDIRTKLFPAPSSYFDAFASPTLFVRAPGRDTPWSHAEALGLLDGPPASSEATSEQGPRDSNNPPSKLHPAANIANKQKADDVAESAGAFGPYDDDIPPLPHNLIDNSATISSSPIPSTSETTTTTLSSSDAEPHQVKRRKVLRRWPPNHQSEDVSLPLFNIIISPPPANSSAGTSESDKLDLAIRDILRTQGTEFAELLKRACFFGRERSVAEEGVTLTTRHSSARGSEQGISAEAMSWLQSQLPKQ